VRAGVDIRDRTGVVGGTGDKGDRGEPDISPEPRRPM